MSNDIEKFAEYWKIVCYEGNKYEGKIWKERDAMLKNLTYEKFIQ